MTLGKGTTAASALRGIVQDIEELNAEMKELRERKTAIMAQAKADGFLPAGIRYVVKARATDPTVRQESEAIRDIYMHAMDLAEEPDVFKAVAALASDELGRGKLIDVLMAMCPPGGEFVMRIGGEPVRIFRDVEGVAKSEPYIDARGGKEDIPHRSSRSGMYSTAPDDKPAKSHVQHAADRAEAAARAKSKAVAETTPS